MDWVIYQVQDIDNENIRVERNLSKRKEARLIRHGETHLTTNRKAMTIIITQELTCKLQLKCVTTVKKHYSDVAILSSSSFVTKGQT